MEDCKDERKRVRDDSEADSPESKILRVNSDSGVNSSASQPIRVDSGFDSSESQLVRVNSGESCPDSDDSAGSREVQLQDDILNILDDTDNVVERDSAIQGLDSVIKSFEEEILAPGPDPEPGQVDATMVPKSGELPPNLGYLLEASDDELGLPPTVAPGEEGKLENEEPGRVGPEGVDLTGFLGFEDDIPNYEAFGFGFGSGLLAECDGGAGGFVTVDGLFDYAETAADVLWRSESLQAM